MERLRDREKGCPWDIAQTFETIAPFTIEEAYEVADAIARQDWKDLAGELGDLLLQVVYHAQIARERGHFAFADVARAIREKMVARHPHIFAQAPSDLSSVVRSWESLKARERAERARERGDRQPPGLLDDIPLALPALTRAAKVQKRAARVGFDWPDIEGVFAKIEEETGELRAARAGGEGTAREAEELGDLLFSVVNLARRLEVDPEEALKAATRKFETRFRRMEEDARRDGLDLADETLEALEARWQTAKGSD